MLMRKRALTIELRTAVQNDGSRTEVDDSHAGVDENGCWKSVCGKPTSLPWNEL